MPVSDSLEIPRMYTPCIRTLYIIKVIISNLKKKKKILRHSSLFLHKKTEIFTIDVTEILE